MVITERRLKEVLSYSATTGLFVWNIKKADNITIGEQAGCDGTNGYRTVMIDGKNYQAHHLAWLYIYGEMPTMLDHRDQDKHNNRISNLIKTTKIKNAQNCYLSKVNKTGFTGVFFDKIRKRYQVSIRVNGRNIFLGRFLDLDDAIKARQKANLKYGFSENHGRRRSD